MAGAVAKAGARAIDRQMENADQRLWRWLTLAPALVLLLALSIIPLVGLVLTSFQNIAWAEGRVPPNLVNP